SLRPQVFAWLNNKTDYFHFVEGGLFIFSKVHIYQLHLPCLLLYLLEKLIDLLAMSTGLLAQAVCDREILFFRGNVFARGVKNVLRCKGFMRTKRLKSRSSCRS